MINPMAAHVMVPLSRNGDVSNLFAVLQDTTAQDARERLLENQKVWPDGACATKIQPSHAPVDPDAHRSSIANARWVALCDHLTGVGNQRSFFDAADAEFAGASIYACIQKQASSLSNLARRAASSPSSNQSIDCTEASTNARLPHTSLDVFS